MKNILHFRHSLALATLLVLFLMPGIGWGQTPYLMSTGDYSETFDNIANTTAWPNGFNGTDCQEWAYVPTNSTGTIPDGKRTTVSTATFTTTTAGGVQRGSTQTPTTASIVLLSTGTTDNTSSCAIDLLLNFTGRNAGTITFNWSTVFNGTGNRNASLRVYTSINGTDFTELTSAQVLNFTNNVSGSGTVNNVALPSTFNNVATARIRFYNYNGTGGTAGSRPKISIDNISVTSTALATAPTLTTNSSSNIAITTATGNGNITATGGSNATARGFCWDIFANPDPDITDTYSTESGSFGTGDFTGSITPLDAETRYKTVAYATNPTGTGYGSAVNFWTLSYEPANHSTTFSSSAISQVQIDLSYDAASTITNADGYIILQKTGSAPTGVPVDATAYTTGNTIGDATVAAIVNSTSSTSTSITGLSAGTHYYFTIIPFNYNGTNNETYNYLTTGTIPGTDATTTDALDATSEVSGPALVGQPDPVTISSTITTLATAVKVFDMDIYDYGTTDALPTKITQLTIYPGSNNTCNWASTIEGIRLSADGGGTFITTGTPVITNASIVIPVTSGNLDIPDGDALTVSLFVYLKTTVVDNSVLEFKVLNTGHGFVAALTGSTFLTAFTTAPTSNQILIDVIATQLSFTTQPSGNACPNTNLLTPPVISAYDANNNLDANFTGQVTLTNSGSIPMANYQMNAIAGIANFLTLQFVQTGDITLSTTNTSSLTNAGPSSSVLISVASVTSPLASNGDASSVLTWTNPTCYDEIMIVAKQGSAVTGTPSGDGTSYTANLVFGTSGTEFGTSDGYVVYKGSTSPQTVTSLTNGQTYHFSYFTRKGTNWSAAATATAIPAPAVFTFRSVASGNWNVVGTWQSSPNGTIWTDATATPGPTNDVFIQSGHIVTLTQNEACKDLHISKGTSSSNNTLGMIAVQTFSLSVNGKLRNYYAAVNTTPGTSNDTYASYPFTGTTGKVLIVGNSRILTNTGEWGATINNPGTGIFPLEINLNSGQTIEIQTSVKTTSFNLLNGTFNASANTISVATGTPGQGNITIGTGTYLISNASSTAFKVFQRTASTLGGVLTVDGTLKLSGTSPIIAMTTINFNGIVEYNGTGSQNFAIEASSGMSPNTYSTLVINNSSGVSMGMDITVNGILNLTSGILNTGTNTLTLGSTGSITGNNSSNFINGKLACTFSAAGSKTFPTGKGTNYRPVTFNYTSLTGSSTVTVEQTEGALPGSIPSGNTLFSTRYWTITESGSTAGAYKVTLDGTGFSPTGAVKMLKGDGTTNLAYAVTGTAPNYTNQTDFTSFSNFGLAEEDDGSPIVYNVTGSGSYCTGTGIPVGLDGSEVDVTYKLYKNGEDINVEVSGNGGPVTFGNQGYGTYTVVATNTSNQSTTMNGSAVILQTTSNAGPPGAGTVNVPFAITDATATEYVSVLWTFTKINGTGNITDITFNNTATLSPDFTSPFAGTFLLKLTVTGTSGCTVFSNKLLYISPAQNPVVWVGSSDTLWGNYANWTPNFIPGDISGVTIPTGCVRYPTIASPALCNTLDIEDGASLKVQSTLTSGNVTIQSGAEVTFYPSAGSSTCSNVTVENGGSLIDRGKISLGSSGTLTVEHPSVSSGGWHLVSSPVSGTVSGLFTGHYLRNYNTYDATYEEIIPTTDPVNSFQGYALWPTSSWTAPYAGGFNGNNLSFTIVGTSASGVPTDNQRWNLIGNPYTSSIDWASTTGWTKSGVDNACYVMNGAGWNTYIGGVSVPAGDNNIIAPTQGFFVRASNVSGGSITINHNAQVHTSQTFYKSSETVVPDLIRLKISGSGTPDETVIRFTSDATDGFDSEYDAYKMFSSETDVAQLYTSCGSLLCINSMPPAPVVPVSMRISKAGTYTIEANEINDLQYVQLEDKENNKFIPIADSSYTFESSTGDFTDRFKLHFSLVSVGEEKVIKPEIYSYQHTVYVNLNDDEGDIFVYNISGQLVNSRSSVKGNVEFQLPVNGTYIIKVIGKKGPTVKKILIM